VDILVIEDNEDNIRLVDYVLRAHGYAPRLATSGAEGMQLALERRPDLILLDIRMPRMDGYEVVAQLKEAGLDATRIVAVTAGDGRRPRADRRRRLRRLHPEADRPGDVHRPDRALPAA
jgi:CheY-like chemotaxis protein